MPPVYLDPAILAGVVIAAIMATLLAGGFARAGFPVPDEARRIGCIDGLRGYLALAVIVHHFSIWVQIVRFGKEWSAPTFNLFNQFGAGAVALFFMITGLVFYPKILAGLGGNSWPRIYVGRIFRLMPLVGFSAVVVSVLAFSRTRQAPDLEYFRNLAVWLSASSEPALLGDYAAGQMNAYVLWSLHYEWIFYLGVLPLCAALVALTRGRLPTWAVPAALLASALIARRFLPHVSLLTYLPLFAIGMLAHEVRQRPALVAILSSPLASVLSVAALALGATLFPTPYGWALPLFAIFFISVACGNSLGGVLSRRGALVLGEISFSIYLLHGIVLFMAFTYGSTAIAAVPLPLVPVLLPLLALVVTALSSATFLFIEKPMIKRGVTVGRHCAALFARRVLASGAPQTGLADRASADTYPPGKGD